MFRSVLLCAAIASLITLSTPLPRTAAQDKKEVPKATVDLFGSVAEEALMKMTPESGVITSTKAWEKLATAWGIKEPAKIDFNKEILVVATTRGSRLNLSPKLDDKGDLKVLAIATRDLRTGFRYAIKSVSKEGIKTVNGKELPKE